MSSQVEIVETPFTITVKGGWFEISGEAIVEFTKEPIEAYLLIRSSGLEPPFLGSTRVYVDGETITRYNTEIKIPARKSTVLEWRKKELGGLVISRLQGTLKRF
jgi:hypothetical protein